MSPDGSTKPSPEEKLLKLIRGKTDKASSAIAAAGASQSSVTHVVIHRPDAAAHGLRWPMLAVGFLSAALVFEFAVLAVDVSRPVPAITIPSIASQPSNEPSDIHSSQEQLPSLTQNTTRPIFASPVVEQTAAKPNEPGKPSEEGKLLAGRLNLMGIVAGETPQVIIEDSQTRKTYFVTTGQVVLDGAILEKVLDNRVILDLNGEKIELSL